MRQTNALFSSVQNAKYSVSPCTLLSTPMRPGALSPGCCFFRSLPVLLVASGGTCAFDPRASARHGEIFAKEAFTQQTLEPRLHLTKCPLKPRQSLFAYVRFMPGSARVKYISIAAYCMIFNAKCHCSHRAKHATTLFVETG